MEKTKIVKYLNGISKVIKELSKEINKFGLDEKSLDLIKKTGSDLLFKGVTLDIV